MSHEPAPLLALERAELGYLDRAVLREVDLEVHPRDYLGLVGPNGSGKTTLLRTLLGALPLRAGALERSAELPTIGYVPQRHALAPFFPIRVLDLVGMGRYGLLGVGRRPGPEDLEIAQRALEQVGLGDRGGDLYRDLSGGQQQRVLIARALACESRLLLLDEPTNGMDLPSQAEILGLIERLHREEGLAVVLVTHDLQVVAAHARRLALLQDGLLKVGSAEDILSPEGLSRTYGVPVEVLKYQGATVVRIAPPGDEERGEEASC